VTDPRRRAIEEDAAHLASADPMLARAAKAAGGLAVPLREPGFATLVWLILGQQVSIAAAKAMFARLGGVLESGFTPEAFLELDAGTLRECGFTRMKAEYARGLAGAIRTGALDLETVGRLPDPEAVAALTSLRGIGTWTAENYLIWALGRRDVFPAGDLALREGFRSLQDLSEAPEPGRLAEHAVRWSPRRTAAAFLIWYAYLGERAGE
jgi:DNA-3-methyladenine glycosylase II